MGRIPASAACATVLCTGIALLCGCTGILHPAAIPAPETPGATPVMTYAAITPDPTEPVTEPVTTAAPAPAVCTPDWSCTEWSSCSTAGTQERTCTDTNACNSPAGRPALSQACTFTPTLPPGGPYEIRITGNSACKKSAEDAVNILKYRASPDYEFFRQYVGAINCEYSNMCYSTGFTTGETPFYTVCIASLEDPPTVYIDQPYWNADPVWLAGVLVHEACHSEGYQEYILNGEGEYDLTELTGWKFERKCCDRMRSTWNQLGAPAYNDDLYRYCSL